MFLKFLWILLPSSLFVLLITFQFIYLKAQFSKNRNIFTFHSNLMELDANMAKRLQMYESPNHFKIVSREGINAILRGDFKDTNLSNIVLENKIRPVHGERHGIPGVISTTGQPDKVPVIELEHDLIYFGSDAIRILYEITHPSLSDVLALSNTFASDVIEQVDRSENLANYRGNTIELFKTAQHQFLRMALNNFELKWKTNSWDITNFDIFKYIIEKNLTTSSTHLILRHSSANNTWILFTLLTYFLLATQASSLSNFFYDLIK